MFGMRQPRVRAFDAGLLVGALSVDPVAEIGVDQLLKRAPAFAVWGREAMVVDQRVEAVAPPIPDMPDEGALMEQLAMLGEEAVAQPIIERLAGKTWLPRAGLRASRPTNRCRRRRLEARSDAARRVARPLVR